MPKRTDIKSILIIGAGPIIIGQACEFDYSGVQACKALQEEAYRVVLVNSNPATIMTDPGFADATYIEPIEWQTVAKIIEKERPDALLATMGGQTALNCALDLDREGVLAQFKVQMIGATRAAIDKAEDREKFKAAMDKIGLESVRGAMAHSMAQAHDILEQVGLPAIIRPSFTMGGTGGGIAYNIDEFDAICERGLDASPTHELLIEESIIGWKEYEMEVVRDHRDNCIIICAIENLDPMGVHTGDSITVAPAQTLTDKEYQIMRNASLAVLREIGIDTGGSNVQFAVNPADGRMIVIEMNPRVSRSSALASKATGFPIAKVAAKLAVGYTLDELRNEITGGKTPASFEPSIDYIVTKIPRFDFVKFPQADASLTTQMKSVGEVMAIGRTFQESLQKAMRGLEIGRTGFDPLIADDMESGAREDFICARLRTPECERLWYLGEAFRCGMTLEKVYECCMIDPWFLCEIKDLIDSEAAIAKQNIASIAPSLLHSIKRKGFADKRLAQLMHTTESAVRQRRYAEDIHPIYKRVDSCAAEFDTTTAYMYSSYEVGYAQNYARDDRGCEARPSKRKKIMVLGGGPNRIGQGIEFDYCCVHAAFALRADGFETIMVNCNPETVSTDYDTSDRLYFEPLTLEDVLEIAHVEKPYGVIVQYGGQTPLNLSRQLEAAGVPIIGTSPESIHKAEDRAYFQNLLHDLKLLQPPNRTASNAQQALKLAAEIAYPLVVRPSYVLGGRAMEIVYSAQELARYMDNAIDVSNESPVLLDSFLSDAIEVDVDAICDGTAVVIGGIMEHIEEAGVHSGDSACAIPPFSLSAPLQEELKRQTREMALAIGVVGLMNVQFAIKEQAIYVLEVNPRASRTVPFVSKATGRPLAKIAARCMAGQSLAAQGISGMVVPPYYSVKEAIFPFNKFPGVDTVLGPEMKSTGEVMGIGVSFGEAYKKSQLAVGGKISPRGCVLISMKKSDQMGIIPVAQYFFNNGYTIVSTEGTARVLQAHGVVVAVVNKVKEGRPNVVDRIKNDDFDLVFNTTENKKSLRDSYTIRREALLRKVTYYTTLAGAIASVEAHKAGEDITVNSLQYLHNQLT